MDPELKVDVDDIAPPDRVDAGGQPPPITETALKRLALLAGDGLATGQLLRTSGRALLRLIDAYPLWRAAFADALRGCPTPSLSRNCADACDQLAVKLRVKRPVAARAVKAVDVPDTCYRVAAENGRLISNPDDLEKIKRKNDGREDAPSS